MTPTLRDSLVASERHIDVWLAYYHEIADPKLHQSYRALLTEEERGKEFRFYFPDDQRRYLVTRALVRTVLSRYLHVPPTDWRFANNRYGYGSAMLWVFFAVILAITLVVQRSSRRWVHYEVDSETER